MSSLLNRFAKAWSNVTRDVVLIVASILIAFALDAWWDNIGQQRVQSEQISTLLAEFETARSAMTSHSDSIQRASQATNNLLIMMGPEATAPDSEMFFELLERSLNFGGAIPNQTALVSILATGNPKIRENESLIDMLRNWPAFMEDIEVDFLHLDQNRDVDLQAALVNIGIGGIGATPSVENLGLPPSSFPIDTARMVQSVEVYAALSYRALRLKVLALSVDEAIRRVDVIIEELARVTGKNVG